MRTNRRHPVACGVDIGSTNVKVVALDPDGAIVARASRTTPRDRHGMCIDGSVLFEVVESLIAETCADVFEAHALSTVGVGEDGLLMDADLHPLTTALAWFDPRRQAILREMRSELSDDELFDVASDAARTMVGWAWARQQPGSEAARTWTAVADLPAVLWTSRRFLSDTLASRTGAWSATSRVWTTNRVSMSLGSESLLPPVVPTGDIIGEAVSPSLQARGSVVRDAIVVAGGHDHPVGGWGVDQMFPGAVLDSMGTAEVVVAQSARAPFGPHERLDIAPGIRSGGTTLLRVVELARNVEWATRDPDVAEWVRILLDGAQQPEPVLEAGYFVPGQRGGSPPSFAAGTPIDARIRASAVLGALACAGRESVSALREHSSAGSAVLLAGGWTRSPGWLRIKDAVNGYRAQPIAEPEVTAVGAALLAATARGWQPDPASAFAGRPY